MKMLQRRFAPEVDNFSGLGGQLQRNTQYDNNRVEVSHQPTRQQERQMRRFKSAAQAQRFLSVHGVVQNLFRVGRHHLKAVHHRLLRDRAFTDWRGVTCAH